VIDASPTEAELGPLVAWAGRMLSQALDVAGGPQQPAGGVESLRGLVLSREGVLGSLDAPRAAIGFVDEAPPLPSTLAAALARAGADDFDAAAIGLALAVEFDPAAARAVACLHDDARRRRLSVDLTAALCAPLIGGWTAGLRRLACDGPLADRGLLAVTGTGAGAEVQPTAAVVRRVTGELAPEPAIAALLTPARAVAVNEHDVTVVRWAFDPEQIVLHVHGGAADALAARVAAALHATGRPAVVVDLAALDACHVTALSAHCLLHGLAALLRLPPAGHPELERVMRVIDAICIVDPGLALWQAGGASALYPVASVELAPLDALERAAALVEGLSAAGMAVADPDAALPFARRYRHGPDAVAKVALATAARVRGAERRQATSADILAVAAKLAGTPLRDLATRVDRAVGFEDLAVPDEVAEQLRELCARVEVRDSVLDDRGYAATIGTARGVSALFAGPSGAGKTLAASVIAGELGLALYRVDLARVVSKYIGETERNLEAVFAAAESTDVVLLFDEADALFGRRSEVSDAHDRYANLEVAYLLQRIETYDGVAILSTNLMRNLDEAFTRRLDFRVLFPFPGEQERRRIWRILWPAGERFDDDVDLDALAEQHELSGGMIRNAVVAAAHLAAIDGAPVSRRHLDHAIGREHDKLGRLPRLLTGVDR